jgi:hypothetical protein
MTNTKAKNIAMVLVRFIELSITSVQMVVKKSGVSSLTNLSNCGKHNIVIPTLYKAIKMKLASL